MDEHKRQLAARGEFFDRLASTWSQAHYGETGGMVPRIARFADALAALVPPPARVLDYGCGTGDIAVALAGRGYEVEGWDASPGMIDNARTLHQAGGLRFTVIEPESDVGGLQFPTGSGPFDAVVCSSVLEYVHDLPRGLLALAGLLKQGGWLLATVPNICHPLRRGENRRRMMMRSGVVRALVRATPWRERYEMQWLSHNRYLVGEWAKLLAGAHLAPVWQDCEDHPLTLLVARRIL